MDDYNQNIGGKIYVWFIKNRDFFAPGPIIASIIAVVAIVAVMSYIHLFTFSGFGRIFRLCWTTQDKITRILVRRMIRAIVANETCELGSVLN